MNCNPYHHLLQAVTTRDFEYIHVCLSKGFNANQIIDKQGSTLLHHVYSIDITKELILYGASVNAKNKFGDTPLHNAVMNCKGLEVVKELLRHGANINDNNKEGYSALYFAILKNDLEVVKELLEYSVDIDIRIFDRTPMVLGTSEIIDQSFISCIKLFIKIIALKNYDSEYRKIIDLACYIVSSDFRDLIDYLDECIYEITKMERDKVVGNHTLYGSIIIKHKSAIPIPINNNIFEEDISIKYPIYQDIIMSNIKLCSEREILFNRLMVLHICIGLNLPSKDIDEKIIILHPDCLYKIAMYLSNNDLFNFIAAFDKNILHLTISCSLLELRKKPEFFGEVVDDVFTWCCSIQ